MVLSAAKVSDTEGGFTGVLDNIDLFGQTVANVGDLDNDGVTDLAVGAVFDDDGGLDRGAVWVLFMNSNGTVRAEQKISSTVGGFTGVLDDGDQFGASVAGLGDLDGDGLGDFAVGARRDDDGGTDRRAVWILSLDGCAAAPACCPGNADGLGGVNFADITSVLSNFGAIGTPGVQNPGDANCDGEVNFADVTNVLANFNLTCP